MARERTAELLLQDKTAEVIEELIVLNEGLIWEQIRKFGLLNDPEASSLGYEALYNAILTFNTSKSNAFSTYATVCIYNRLGSYVRSLNTIVRKNTISYDVCIDDKGTSHLDSLESNLTADGSIITRDSIREILRLVDECLYEINNDIQRNILEVWRSSGFKATHKEIASELDCSQSYVSQTLKRFRQNLKNKLEVVQ